MGNVTFATLRNDAGLLGGDDTMDAQVAKKVKRWLRQEAAAWPWPELKQRYSGVALAASSRRLLLGGGTGSATDESGNVVTLGELLRIEDPIWVYDSVYGTQIKATIIPLGDTSSQLDESSLNPATNLGSPQNFKVRKPRATAAGALGAWLLIPAPIPDRAYLLAFDAYVMPADPADNEVLWYPNDETTTEAIVAFMQAYKDGYDSPAFTAAMTIVSGKVVKDRQAFGVVPGTNQLSTLDPGVFR
jgi:hypothetical protein